MSKTPNIITSALLTAAIGSASGASPLVLTDHAAFIDGLAESHVEPFESMGAGAVTALTFSGEASASVSSVGAEENTILTDKDGYGAISMGPGDFWKLRAGTTTIDLDTAWDAFGFWFSDLEGATLVISLPELGFSTNLDDDNSNQNHFFGVRTDEPFSRVTVAWTKSSADGIGIDDVVVGRAIPAPGAAALATASFLCVARIRSRKRRPRAPHV